MKPIVIVLITCLATIVVVRLYDLMMEKYGPRINNPAPTQAKTQAKTQPKTQPKTAEEELKEAVLAGRLSCNQSDYNRNATSFDKLVTNKNSYYGELEKIGVFHEYCYANNNNPPPCPTHPPTNPPRPTPQTLVSRVIQYNKGGKIW